MTEPSPPTRWARGGEANAGYALRFAELVEAGDDVDGEARLADALLPRGGRVLDAGSGMGRVGAALLGRGHRVVGCEPDAALVAQSRRTYPGLTVLPVDVLELNPAVLEAAGAPTGFDLVTCVGNVMIFLAEGTERAVLRRLRDLLSPTGRLLVGFHLEGGPTTSRVYRAAEFVSDAEAAGLRVDLRLGGYDLRPADPAYAVWVLSRDDAPAAAGDHRTVTHDPA